MDKKLEVSWMHCKSCEMLLENRLNEIDWVKVKNISSKTWEINIEIKNEKDLKQVKEAIEELWYHTWWKKHTKKNNFTDYIIMFLIFVIVWILILLFKDISLFENILKVENYSFLIIILIWIVASMSSCLAITWWIILGFSKYVDTSKWISSHIKIQWMFHLWRILWFFVLGWILWSIWNYIWWFWSLNKVLLLIAWILMFYMWLNMLSIVPSITKLWLSMPKSIWNKILNVKNPIFTPIVWALTFFLPCWFTQSMQVLAASSWSFLSWALTMTAFAVWTFPILFLVWVGNSYFKDKNLDMVNKVIWVIVVYFWVFILSGFSNMINFNIPQNTTQTQVNTENLQELKEVSVTHDWWWFPDVILEWAKNYKLIINPTSDWLGCMFALTIPWIDENEYPVKKWVPIVIDIKNPKPGKYKAVCTAMWMRHGNIIIK